MRLFAPRNPLRGQGVPQRPPRPVRTQQTRCGMAVTRRRRPNDIARALIKLKHAAGFSMILP